MNFPIDPLIVDIPDFPGYQISDLGAVYNKKTGRELKTYSDRKGYLKIELSKDKDGHGMALHRLLAICFILNPQNKPQVDHINQIKCDNRLCNLRWVDFSENNTNKQKQLNNTSGQTGVLRRVDNTNKNQKYYWIAKIGKNHKRYTRQFPYTEDGFEKAKKWYLEKKQELHTYN